MNKFKKFLPIYLFIIVNVNLSAQQAFMVKDISSITLPSEPELLTKNGDDIYFYANDGIHGNELWRTDGTFSETVLVKDINPGKADCYHASWTNNYKPLSINNILYFVAKSGGVGFGLWRTDGTSQGTYLVKEIVTYSWDIPQFLTNFNDTLYFYADDGLWKCDGTTSGTIKIKNVDASNLIVANNSLLFTTSGSNNSRLWKSDGTETGTVIVKEFNGSIFFATICSIAYNNKLYFSVSENYYGIRLWMSDGTTSGTIPVVDNMGDYIIYHQELVVSNNNLFITGYDSAWQQVLWKSNGIISGTEKIYTFKHNYTGFVHELIDINGTLFFQAKDSTVGNYNNEDSYLWKSDGTTEGTEVITTLTSLILIAYPTSYDNNLFLCAFDSINGYELWKSDGTSEGTHIVKNIYPGDRDAFPSYLTTLNDKLIFAANDGVHGNELWISDGTEEGTNLIRDVNTIGDSYIDELTKVGDNLYFTARTEVDDDPKLWLTDGTNTGTNMVPIPEGLILSSPKYLAEYDGAVYFFIENDGIYKSDGTATGTLFIKPTIGKNMVCLDDMLYGDSKPGFWKSDGTTAGSNNITNNAGFNQIISVDNLLYLNSSHGLFKSDGTESGTELLMTYEFSDGLASINNLVYFTTKEYDSTKSLFSTDGTTQGTIRVKEMRASNLTAVGNTLFCSGSDNMNNPDIELWKSDGTNTGTILVKNLNLSAGSTPKGLTDINGTLYFIADDGIHGLELWRSDGTEEGTIMIKDINSGPGNSFSSNPDSIIELVAIDTLVFFTANDGVNGYELWKSDGTEDGTVMVNDINSTGSSYPKHLTIVGQTIFYTAYEEIHGRELWAYGISERACLANGISFLTQSDVDNFQVNYPGCARIEGEVFISGDDISDLSSLLVLKSFGDNVIVGNTTALFDLSGFDNTVTIDGNLVIGDNDHGGNSSLTSLSGLNNLSSIYGDLVISNNNALSTLDGINNLNPLTIFNLFITDNPLLSTCGVRPVCDYLSNQNGSVVIQNNSPGCDSENEVNYACLVHLSEPISTSSITVYPNPATNEIMVVGNNGAIINELTIYNIHGQKVKVNHEISDNIDISTLGHGIFIIELVTNEKRYREKLIIQ